MLGPADLGVDGPDLVVEFEVGRPRGVGGQEESLDHVVLRRGPGSRWGLPGTAWAAARRRSWTFPFASAHWIGCRTWSPRKLACWSTTWFNATRTTLWVIAFPL